MSLGQIESSVYRQIYRENRKQKRREELAAAAAAVAVVIDFLLDSVISILAISSPKMSTMRDEGERTCPLCAEEMDLTDLQLKPCKCGYDICVWCWNQIIDLAETQNTEGRCPACRRPYDKERIVGAATNCERVIPELFGEKKQKSQKGKPRVSSAESRKHLSSVRVIQRNLVYIVGLPLSLSDENMLEHREYFGQYGKVLKVSISRSATGAQQTSSNNTFSVYITYAKEEEAVRCIQSVHNFILEGKPLRACFGTTKYCHAWLRNLSCSNPDCFYLHDIGSEDDSFSKDEIISAYTRSRVPQVISNNLHRRSGSKLPPPVDDFCNSGTSSTKIMVKSSSNNSVQHTKYFSPIGVSTRSNVLPAAASWGSRASNPLSSSTSCLQGSSKQTQVGPHHISNVSPETCDQSSAWNDDLTEQLKFPENQIGLVDSRSSQSLEPSKSSMGRHSHTIASNSSDVFGFSRQSSAWNDDQTSEERCQPIFNGRLGPLSGDFETMSNSLGESSHGDQITSAWDDDDDVITAPSMSEINNDVPLIGRYEPVETLKSGAVKALGTNLSEFSGEALLDTTCNSETAASNLSNPAALENTKEDNIPQKEYSCFEEVDTPSNCTHGYAESITAINPPNVKSVCVNLSSVRLDEHQGTPAKHYLANSPIMKEPNLEKHFEHTTSVSLQKSPVVLQDNHDSGESSGWTSELWRHFSPSIGSKVADFPEPEAGNDQRGMSSGIVGQTSFLHPTQSSSIENASRATYEYNHHSVGSSKDIRSIDRSSTTSQPFIDDDTRFRNEYQERRINSLSKFETDCGKASGTDKGSSVDMGETNIISDFLSMDFDSWYSKTTAENNLLQVLQNGKTNPSWKIPGSQDGQNSSQSRFSFARQENDLDFLKILSHELETSQHEGNNKEHLGACQNTHWNTETYTAFNHAQTVAQSDRSSVARANVSAPPGFSVPNRSPPAPPGFSSQDRLLQSHGSTPSGSNMLQNTYQLTQLPNVLDDLELADPAILVCKRSEFNTFSGSRYFPAEINASENDPRYQLMMRQNMPTREAQLNSGQAGEGFLPINDSYYHKQFIGQTYGNMSHFATQMPNLTSRNSVMSNNSQWPNWNEMQLNGSSLDPLENLRLHEYSNYFSNNEEHKFRMTDGGASGNLYGRSFGL